MELVIGAKRWSSWSMRPWLVLKRAGAPFRERLIPLSRQGAAPETVLAFSPSGRVPALRFGPEEGGRVIWDSLAIAEYVADRYPEAGLWPADPLRRSVARAATAEMHAGFTALRAECPMDLSLRTTVEPSEACRADIRRVVALWRELRGEAAADRGDPFLFGAWTVADAFYTPVATRFSSYGIDLAAFSDEDGSAQAYADALLATPEFLAWEADA